MLNDEKLTEKFRCTDEDRLEWLSNFSWLVLFLKLENDVVAVYLSNIVCTLRHDCCVWSFFTMNVFML